MASWEDQVPAENTITTKFSAIDIDAPEFIPGRGFVTKSSNPIPPPEVIKEPAPTITNEVPNGEPTPSSTKTATKASAVAEGPEPSVPVKKPKPTVDLTNKKETVNMVFIGHVDAGKSTIGGNLLFLTGTVDKRTLEKYEKEAKEKGRESWYLSWALDTNIEEREKGKTVECGRGYFETVTRQFVLVDAPGHKSFVPNMISGASIADLAILVISARKGEFETGFEKGGQTREHAMLVKTIGVKRLIVLINKMDDPTVQWDEKRYNECKEKLLPFLKKVGFQASTDLYFMPCSGYTGAFLRDAPAPGVCPWFDGPPLLEYLDAMPGFERNVDAPLRFPISEKFKDMGTFVGGKIESGQIVKGQELLMMPNGVKVEVSAILENENEVDGAIAGTSCKLKLKGIEEEDISIGFVLCDPDSPCKVASQFDAQVAIMEYKSIICSGFTAVMHLHTCTEEVEIKLLICRIDKKTGEKTEVKPKFFKKDEIGIIRFRVMSGAICMEAFKDFAQMGRFTLRDEGKTIAVGKILKIIPPKDSNQNLTENG